MSRSLRLPPLVCTALLALFSAGAARAQLGVASVSPARNAVDAPTATTISMTFTSAVDPQTVTTRTCGVFGRWSGVMDGTFAFSNGNRTATFTPARPFFPGETVMVSASTKVSGPGGSLPHSHAFSFWTRAARGSGNFSLGGVVRVRMPGEGGLRTYGAYAGDLDGDGSPDLTVPNEDVPDARVMLNTGCGTFGAPVSHPVPAGSKPSTNEGADFNGDGILDLAVGNIGGKSISVLIGTGGGNFQPAVTYPSGDGTRGLAVFDVEGDGDMDVITANRISSNMALHENNGDGTFKPARLFDGGGDNETGVVAADADGDGIMDLFVACYGSKFVTLLLGDGNGGFNLSATQPVDGSPWMIAAGDLDGDGNVDVVTANSTNPRASVVRGDGLGGLLPAVSYTVGTFPIAIDVGDLDGDGDLDAVASNFRSVYFTVLWNDGTGNLGSSLTLPARGAGSCALVVDYDRDGDMDLLGIDEIDDLVLLFRQAGPSPAGVQLADCAATLRVDNLASRAGYGGTSPHPVPVGGQLFVGLTAAPGVLSVVAIGAPLEPGIPTFLGTLNLALAPISFLPAQIIGANGEASLVIPIPAGTAPGGMAALQGIVVDPAHPDTSSLTNPELIVLQ